MDGALGSCPTKDLSHPSATYTSNENGDTDDDDDARSNATRKAHTQKFIP